MGRAWAAVILAGGRASRLGGIDKPGLRVGGTTLLARAVTACSGASAVVVVGTPRPLPVDVTWTVEDPPGTGPVAAIAAGLAPLPDDVEDIVLLAADLPRVSQLTVARLRAWRRHATSVHRGAVLVDDTGREQWLMSVWQADALRAALPKATANRSLGRMLTGVAHLRLPAAEGETDDIDTQEDLDRHG